MPIQTYTLLFVLVSLPVNIAGDTGDQNAFDATTLLTNAVELTRGSSSHAEIEMTIHRPEWTRSSSFETWTQGLDKALIRFITPPRDAGNATLKNGDRMWTYSPKVRRTIRLPSSMMSQNWAGSDFSYSDLSRSDEILTQYSHEIISTRVEENYKIYTIEATPKENSPVVWGKEVLDIRADYVILKHSFFDQSRELVKTIQTLEIAELGGRTMPIRMRVSSMDEPEKWTEIRYEKAEFDIEIDDNKFSLFSLRSSN
ncbi:MAG: outer membrane lipoprotein-sorting protein [Gammaproteobacteria bacterium]|nr:outer membrane lipoprotein-sorting protein [Gammaproteobacteria bacterium]MDE0251698.1 outer membrane lipoprotein-sorting protein [Gammaproteobacteria bacterium]MDE0403293.1 outer membrane lipoprotein-sorting protein [Gammaproteobacteria bacterium]